MANVTSDFNKAPANMRLTISFFGKRNAGKSSLVNAITGQNLSIVSDNAGTTTDPVRKAMELLPLGPVTIIDTAGIDDTGELGELRTERTARVLKETDFAVFVTDGNPPDQCEKEFLNNLESLKTPYIVVINKTDKIDIATELVNFLEEKNITFVKTSVLSETGINYLKTVIADLAKPHKQEKTVISDRLRKSDVVLLVTPVDSSAPKGRLILPQVQTIRDLLDAHCCTFICQTEELENALSALKNPPALVITDSQVFNEVNRKLPEGIPLTSFSILFARLNGILETAVKGAEKTDSLKDGDHVLISEGCTHHRQCDDIGTVKLPFWIEEYTGKKLNFEFTSGKDFPSNPEDLKKYELVIHCGGCMLTAKEMINRMNTSGSAGVNFTNYGTIIAKMNGILEKSLEILNDR